MTMRLTWRAVLLVTLSIGAFAGCSKDASSAQAANTPQTNVAAGAATPTAAPQAGQSEGETLGTGDALQLAADYERQCASEEKPSRDCEPLRGLLVVEVAMALEEIDRSGDQRGTQEALAALDFSDEPDILIAACRVLGRFPDTPGVGARVLPFALESPYLEVQRVAAALLKAGPDPGLAEVGGLWLQNHDTLQADTNYDAYPDLPAHYASLGFPDYPGAEWFSPADSDRSIGFSTKENVATVSRWFADSLKSPAIGVQQWLSERNAAVRLPDQSKMARMQQLVEKVVKGDQAARAEIEKLQKEFEIDQQKMERAAQQSVGDLVPPSSASAMSEARWIVAQRKDGRVSRVVLVYPLRGLQRTVIQVVWDLSDYPSAWPARRGQ
jgi:hypothetical protein